MTRPAGDDDDDDDGGSHVIACKRRPVGPGTSTTLHDVPLNVHVRASYDNPRKSAQLHDDDDDRDVSMPPNATAPPSAKGASCSSKTPAGSTLPGWESTCAHVDPSKRRKSTPSWLTSP